MLRILTVGAALLALERVSQPRGNAVWFRSGGGLFNADHMTELAAWNQRAREIGETVGEEPLDIFIQDPGWGLSLYLIEPVESEEDALFAVEDGQAVGGFVLARASADSLSSSAGKSLKDLGISPAFLVKVDLAELPPYLISHNLGFRMYRLLGDVMLNSGATAIAPARNFEFATSYHALRVWRRLNDTGNPNAYFPEAYWMTRKVVWP